MLVLCLVLRVDRLDLHVPFTYWGDALYFDSWVKGLMNGNWPWHNDHLGMPFGADWQDFPINMTIEVVMVRILAIFTSSPGLVLNLLWLLGTAASAGFAAYCLQRLGVARWIAASLAIIYALQPFTFYRGVSHLNLIFYLVPLLATAAVEIAAGRIQGGQSDGLNTTPTSRSKRLSVTLRSIPAYIYVACLAQGFSYIYNSFFSVVLVAVAALLARAVYRRKSALAASALMVTVICGATLINLAPSLAYWAEHGTNPAMAYKSPAMAEIYGLKLRHLLTPIPENPLPPIRYIQEKLDNAGFPGENENAMSRLGTIGSVGLLFLLTSALISCLRKPFGDNAAAGVLGACSALTLACLLLATVGGFGALFNVFVAPDIRCYNRIVVFIDFFALTAVGLLLTRASAWLRRNCPGPILAGTLVLLIVFGVSDEAIPALYRDHAARESQFKLDDAFVRSIESTLPRNASVFQLPVSGFPADGAPFQMRIYDQARPYLHSDTLRWSWGAVSGREGGEWVRQTSNLPAKEMLKRLSAVGFSGVWIDRLGYAPGASPEREIQEALGSQPLQRSDGRIAFYGLRAYTEQLRTSDPHHNAYVAQQYALHPIEITFPTGFYAEERNDKQTWRWCSRHGVMQLHNALPQPRTLRLAMTLQTSGAKPETITISAAGQSERIELTTNTESYARKIQLPPMGTASVSFDCECKPINAPGDSRSLYFALVNPRVVE